MAISTLAELKARLAALERAERAARSQAAEAAWKAQVAQVRNNKAAVTGSDAGPSAQEALAAAVSELKEARRAARASAEAVAGRNRFRSAYGQLAAVTREWERSLAMVAGAKVGPEKKAALTEEVNTGFKARAQKLGQQADTAWAAWHRAVETSPGVRAAKAKVAAAARACRAEAAGRQRSAVAYQLGDGRVPLGERCPQLLALAKELGAA